MKQRVKVLCIHSRYIQMSWLQYQVQQTSYGSVKVAACFHVIMYWSVAIYVTSSVTSLIGNMPHTNASDMSRAYLAAIQVKVCVECEDKILTCEHKVELVDSPVTHMILWWKYWYWNSQYLPSVINMQTLLQLYLGWTVWGWIFSAPIQTGAGIHPASCTALFLGGYWLGRGVDRLPPYNTEVKEGYSYTSPSPLGLHGLLYGEL
jgi:hypothetical protein